MLCSILLNGAFSISWILDRVKLIWGLWPVKVDAILVTCLVSKETNSKISDTGSTRFCSTTQEMAIKHLIFKGKFGAILRDRMIQ